MIQKIIFRLSPVNNQGLIKLGLRYLLKKNRKKIALKKNKILKKKDQ